MTRALRLSLNVPAVQVLEAFGPQTFHDRLVNAGATLYISGRPNLSMVLGGLGTSLESILVLYSALARNGITGMPRMIKNDPVQERYLMSRGAAWIIGRILSQPMPDLKGSAVFRPDTHGVETGTSYGFRDAWAFGIMGDYVAGVWIGRPDGTPVPDSTGPSRPSRCCKESLKTCHCLISEKPALFRLTETDLLAHGHTEIPDKRKMFCHP